MRALIVIAALAGAALGRDFVVIPSGSFDEVKGQIPGLAWRFKPDSALVLLDKQGNQPFTAAEDSLLGQIPGVLFVPEDSVAAYLAQSGWNGGE